MRWKEEGENYAVWPIAGAAHVLGTPQRVEWKLSRRTSAGSLAQSHLGLTHACRHLAILSPTSVRLQ